MRDDQYYNPDLNYDVSVLQARLDKFREVDYNERLEVLDEIEQDVKMIKRKTELDKIRLDIEFEELLETLRI